jgi:very-short-patch-repair endonuclease
MEQQPSTVPGDNNSMTVASDYTWSLSAAAVLEPWRRRARGEFPIEPRLRPGPTDSELVLWAALRERREGWCREYATGRYRLDFYLPKYKLAIEVDGSSHDGPVRKAADDQRDAWHQARLGIVTVRYNAAEVMRDCQGVIADVERRLAALTVTTSGEAQSPTSDSLELPVVVAEAEFESLARANENAEGEITGFVAQASITILPIFEQRSTFARLLSMIGR